MTGRPCILVLNAGSSSLKFALFEAGGDPVLCLKGQVEGIGRGARFEAAPEIGLALPPPPDDDRMAGITDHANALALIMEWLSAFGKTIKLVAVGHRVVHGGPDRCTPERVTPAVIEELESYVPLAPLHQPHNLAAIRALTSRFPNLPQVACFDTAFHAGQPEVATHIGLPRSLRQRGLRRYGFHGLSYEYIVSRLPDVTGAPLPDRLVIAHLGNGASLAAVKDGRAEATTMGFSTLDGLLMGTRCGALDPGVILYLMREHGMDLAALTDLLYHRCGLAGVSGISGDMRKLLASNDPAAAEAVELFCYRFTRSLGSLAAALGGLDALVFTGGIGEHAAPVRLAVCEAARWLGVTLDPEANTADGPCITTPSSTVSAWVIPTDEELVIARHTQELVDLAPV